MMDRAYVAHQGPGAQSRTLSTRNPAFCQPMYARNGVIDYNDWPFCRNIKLRFGWWIELMLRTRALVRNPAHCQQEIPHFFNQCLQETVLSIIMINHSAEILICWSDNESSLCCAPGPWCAIPHFINKKSLILSTNVCKPRCYRL